RHDLLCRLAAELVRVHRERLAYFAAGEHLHEALAARHQPALVQQLRRHNRTGVEPRRQRVEVHDLVLDPERVVKPALRHAAVQRHLTAFEASLEPESGARLRALVSASRSLSLARPLPAADPLLRMLGALRRTQITE